MTELDRSSTRRDFLTGRAVRREVERAGGRLADELTAAGARVVPSGGSTVRLSTRAMACDFAVLMNPGPSRQVMLASDALDLVHALEDQMTVYRDYSEMSRLNRTAHEHPFSAERQLFDLLLEARRICVETHGAFDPTSGPLIAVWRRAKAEGRVPSQHEIDAARALTGIEHVAFDESHCTVAFDRAGVELNLGGIGKGYALDRAAALLEQEELSEFLIHGGHSSLLARGDHNAAGGWPVGIRNPLFPTENFATLVLRRQALSSSGSGTQLYRHGGRRYGHILDPRTGWPVEGMLSVTVVAQTAAEADALSTAFFVGGVEFAREYCHNYPQIGALLIPPPRPGRALDPVVCGIPDEQLFFAESPNDEIRMTKE